MTLRFLFVVFVAIFTFIKHQTSLHISLGSTVFFISIYPPLPLQLQLLPHQTQAISSTMTNATPPIPVTIITGFLGSGKTTLLLSLLPQLPGSYNLCLLKNEFGDVEIDSRLASQASISGVTELLNGCICCNLVGQLGEALIALRDDFKPHRIVIETSGSAFPATLAMVRSPPAPPRIWVIPANTPPGGQSHRLRN